MSTVTNQNETSRGKSLRLALRGNGVFSALCGLAAIVGAASIAEFMGISQPLPLSLLGAALIAYAGLLFLAAGQNTVDRRHGILATILDIGWVVGSVAILLTGWPALTAAGKWTVALIAEVVAAFALWQAYAMGLLGRRGG